ncbi:ABC transporter permease [Deinococcus alpinitundrae]|uniref:ABC transporter permease n=1 Tax=Deinococcus alpinitundrae TaxID=468913 RepID=UPI00137A8A46|nr:ABC transporter permease [Deinococcus alpinitundrae]
MSQPHGEPVLPDLALSSPVDPPRRSLASRFLRANEASVILATVGLVLFIGLLHPSFLQPSQLINIVQQAVFVGILAAGLSFLMSMREIDLSVESTFALTLVSAALLMKAGLNPWLAALAALVLGALLGGINAAAVQYFKIPSLIATLATLSMFRGLVFALSNGQQVTGLPLDHPFFSVLSGNFLGLPLPIWCLIILIAVLSLIMGRTPYGYRVRQIGSNPAAASFSGIPVARVRVQSFMLAGLLAAVAGLLGLSYFTSADPNIGGGFSLSAVAAVVIGGTPLRGGVGTVPGAVLGAVLLTVVTSGLVYFNVPANWSQFATGLVILIAVSLDSVVRNRNRGSDASES